jgi:hypothetical protein
MNSQTDDMFFLNNRCNNGTAVAEATKKKKKHKATLHDEGQQMMTIR